MICPSKTCQAEIPDDSLFCDQCGIRILKCSNCGRIALGKFCGKCGGKMIPVTSDKKNDMEIFNE